MRHRGTDNRRLKELTPLVYHQFSPCQQADLNDWRMSEDVPKWLEYLADGPNADFFAPAIENTPDPVVPSLSLCEVFRRVLQQRGEGDALQAVAVMSQTLVVDLDTDLALRAAEVSVECKLPMADTVMLATAQL